MVVMTKSSDILNGLQALMKSPLFRNKNYHQETDTIDTLNFEAMAEVLKGLYYTLLEI